MPIIISMQPSDAVIQIALRVAARVIDRYGDVYWPLFERLERELSNRRSRAARLRAHLDNADLKTTNLRTFHPEKDERSSRVRPV